MPPVSESVIPGEECVPPVCAIFNSGNVLATGVQHVVIFIGVFQSIVVYFSVLT